MKNLLLMLLIPVYVMAETGITHDAAFEYTLTEEGAVLTGVSWNTLGEPFPAAIALPDTLGGLPVTDIADNALSTSGMQSSRRFALIIPEGVLRLAEGALACCHNADSISLPASLAIIPEGSFHHVTAEVTLHPDNPFFTNGNGFLVDKATDTLLYASPSADGRVLPVARRYGADCLSNWVWGKPDIAFPDGVEEIGSGVIYDVLGLESVSLPGSPSSPQRC